MASRTGPDYKLTFVPEATPAAWKGKDNAVRWSVRRVKCTAVLCRAACGDRFCPLHFVSKTFCSPSLFNFVRRTLDSTTVLENVEPGRAPAACCRCRWPSHCHSRVLNPSRLLTLAPSLARPVPLPPDLPRPAYCGVARCCSRSIFLIPADLLVYVSCRCLSMCPARVKRAVFFARFFNSKRGPRCACYGRKAATATERCCRPSMRPAWRRGM